MTARRAVLVFVLVIGLLTPPLSVSGSVCEFEGSEWVDLFRSSLEELPNLGDVLVPGAITGNTTTDERIWQLADARGYEMRPTPVEQLVTQDGHPMQVLLADAWEQLQAAAHEAGHELRISSAYRSVSSQRVIFNRKLNGTSDAAIDALLVFSAPPGASRHHTGYAIDIHQAGGTFNGFSQSAAYVWISADNYANAKLFGFIPSYPDDAPPQGPKPEAWEYVYVGTERLVPRLDKVFFYRGDGVFSLHDLRSGESLGADLVCGDAGLSGWSVVAVVDSDNNGTIDKLFY